MKNLLASWSPPAKLLPLLVRIRVGTPLRFIKFFIAMMQDQIIGHKQSTLPPYIYFLIAMMQESDNRLYAINTPSSAKQLVSQLLKSRTIRLDNALCKTLLVVFTSALLTTPSTPQWTPTTMWGSWGSQIKDIDWCSSFTALHTSCYSGEEVIQKPHFSEAVAQTSSALTGR